MAGKTKEINIITTEECHAIWDIPETLIRNNLYRKDIVLPDDIYNYKTFRDILTMIVSKRCPPLQNLIIKDMDDAIKNALKNGLLELDFFHDWDNCCPKCSSKNVDTPNSEETLVDDSNTHFWVCLDCGHSFRTCTVHILAID